MKMIWHYIKNYRLNNMIIRNIVIVFLVLVTSVGVISGLFYNKTSEIINNEVAKTGEISLNKVRDIVDFVFKEMDDLALYISIQDKINIFMNSGEVHEHVELLDIINSIIRVKNISRFKFADSVYIVSNNSDEIISNRGVYTVSTLADSAWYNAYLQSDSKKPIVLARKDNGTYPYYATLIRPIFSSDTVIGCVAVNINIEGFERLLKDADSNVQDEVIILDDFLNVVYSNDINLSRAEIEKIYESGERFGEATFDGKDYIYMYIDSKIYDVNYLSLIPLSRYKSSLNGFAALMINIIALYGIFLIAIALFISIKMFQLLALLNKMEATALGSQINHHFLSNTLDTIKWKALKCCDDKSIITMITRLSDLYRICAMTDAPLVSLRDEIEYAKIYINILKARYEGKFTVNWDIDEGIIDAKIIKLCLQPLIENAYYHGIKPNRTFGAIDINGSLHNGYIEITITDNGVGIAGDKLTEINSALQQAKIHDLNHIGVENVNARIKLVMGKKYGLTLHSSPDGTTVVIRIPTD